MQSWRSPGVQKLLSYLSASLTQEEVAEAVSRVLSPAIPERQELNITQPVGEAFLQREINRCEKSCSEVL
jgi:hypothetical protein